jgi:hypothetical protein
VSVGCGLGDAVEVTVATWGIAVEGVGTSGVTGCCTTTVEVTTGALAGSITMVAVRVRATVGVGSGASVGV